MQTNRVCQYPLFVILVAISLGVRKGHLDGPKLLMTGTAPMLVTLDYAFIAWVKCDVLLSCLLHLRD